MKYKKIACLLISAILLCNTGCAEIITSGGYPQTSSFSATDVTDKYSLDSSAHLNGEKAPEPREEMWVIVELEEDSVMDVFESGYSERFADVSAFTSSETGKYIVEDLTRGQDSAIRSVKRSGIGFLEFGPTYKTLLNGFAAKIKTADYAALKQLKGVKSVIISEEYEVPVTENYGALREYLSAANSDATMNKVDVHSTGIYDTSSVDYNGSGMLIAILDTGFDKSHSMFQRMPEEQKLEKTDVADKLGELRASELANVTEKDLYYNAKVPYAFDYADNDANVYPGYNDHGVHVAGILAGEDDVVTGVATQAQLAIMKVFSDNDTSSTPGILAALEDCVTLGVDVINMSLGASAGFSSEDPDGEYRMNEIYSSVRDAGISLVVAASNSYSSAYGGTYGNTNLASNPDSGTIGSPASYPSALSVASISGRLTPYLVCNGSTVAFFTEAYSLGSQPYDFVGGMLGTATAKTFEYVTIPGDGASSDYDMLDVRGKIALVRRGNVNFLDKVRYAARNGAVGCIVYNNVTGSIRMSVETLYIPTCSIPMDAGLQLASQPSGTIVIDKNNAAGPFMSDFSSWGPLPSLELKPKITAHGGEIYSAFRNGYSSISGTSMASPNMAGAVTLVRQYVTEHFPDLNIKERSALVNQLLMSTATIALNEEGNPYSPRKQGAGLGSIYNSVNTGAYLYVEGTDKTKIELGDDPQETGLYQMSFRLNNFSDIPLTYTLSPYVMTETMSLDNKTVAEKATLFEDAEISFTAENATISGNRITVGAGVDTEIQVTVRLSDADKKYLKDNFKNGMYVEGFIKFISNNSDGIDLSIPYLGFFGDWTKAPMFDIDSYTVSADEVDKSINEEDKTKADVYATVPVGLYNNGSMLLPLGTYIYKQPDGADKVLASMDKNALSYYSNSIYALYSCYAGLLRGAKEMHYTITDAVTGEVILDETKINQRKSYNYNGTMAGSSALVGVSPYGEKLANNTKYIFTMEGKLDYGDGGVDTNLRNSYSFTFYVDFEAPTLELEKCKFRKETERDGKVRYYVDIAAYDNHYIEAYMPCLLDGTSAYMLEDYYQPVYDGVRNGTNIITLELTDWMDRLKDNKLGIQLQDYALNSRIYEIHLPEEWGRADADEVQITETELTLKTGETKALTIEAGENVWLNDLVYTFTDDEGNVSVLADAYRGEVRGLAAGVCNLTVTNPLDPEWSHTIRITVTDEILDANVPLNELKITGIIRDGEEYQLSSEGVTEMVSNMPFYLKLQTEPWNATGVEVVWSSTSEKYCKIDPDGRITFLDTEEDREITVRATYKTYSALAKFKVKVAFFVEDRILKAYYGAGGDVVIPEKLGILYINNTVFYKNETITSVTIPEGVTDIRTGAFYGCTNLTKVTLPSSLMIMQDSVFAGCSKLNDINLEAPKTGLTIGASVFSGCKQLADVDLSMLVVAGQSAFSECASLRSVDITNLRMPGTNMFYKCTGLTEVIMEPHTVLSEGMFSNCTGLLTLSIASPSLPNRVFQNCSSLTSVKFTEDIDSIGTMAFQNCAALTSVTFRKNVREIGQQAFAGCTSLSTLKLPDGLETLGTYAFQNCTALMSVLVSKNAVLSDVRAQVFAGCTNLEEFSVMSGSTRFAAENGILYGIENGSKVSLLLIPNRANLTGYTIPAGVKEIASGAFSAREDVTSIDLGGVERIGAYAFYDCRKLTNVTFTDSLKSVGDYAFSRCIALDSIAVPVSVTELGIGTFSGSTSLIVTFNEPEKSKLTVLPELALSNTGIRTIVLPSGLTEIGTDAFFLCENLTSISLPASVKKLGDTVFRACSKLRTAELSAVTEMGEYVFQRATALESVSFAEGATVIGDFAFGPNFTVDDWGNVVVLEDSVHKALTTVTIPASVEEIGNYAFAFCTGLENLNLANVKRIGAFAFTDCTQLKDLSFDSLEVLGAEEYAGKERISQTFYNCTSLTSISMPNLEKIYESAFYGCTNLETVKMPRVKYIGIAAFYNCSLLRDVDFASATTVDAMAFQNCASLGDVTLPEATGIGAGAFMYANNMQKVVMPKVTAIGERAFYGCSKLKEASFPVAEEIYDLAFYNTKLTNPTLPATLEKVGAGAFGALMQCDAITVAEGNAHFFVEDGVLYEILPNGGYQLACYPSGKTGATYRIKEGTVRIQPYAACYNSYLTSVTLPATLKSVGAASFYRCGNLQAYEFLSYEAPTLEAYLYETSLPQYNYDNFYDLFGTFRGIFMSKPSNGVGYDNYIWENYFEHIFDGPAAADAYTFSVINAIDGIGEVLSYSEELEARIKAARDLYDGISSDSQKLLVTNYEKLTDAEKKLAEWKGSGDDNEKPEEPEKTGCGAVAGDASGGFGGMMLLLVLAAGGVYIARRRRV